MGGVVGVSVGSVPSSKVTSILLNVGWLARTSMLISLIPTAHDVSSSHCHFNFQIADLVGSSLFALDKLEPKIRAVVQYTPLALAPAFDLQRQTTKANNSGIFI